MYVNGDSMYSLMLVEDEPIVLEGMLKIIDFESLGFRVVSSCANGLEALEAYNKYKPDVVVTDICMEIMDGLEFIEEVSRVNNTTKFVIVSGHQDFKFFKRALSLKVTDYILKPVTAREFRELLLRISEELKQLKEDNFEPINHFGAYVEVEKHLFFNQFMHVKMDKSEVDAKLEGFGITFSAPLFQVAMYKVKQLSQTAVALGYKSAHELLDQVGQDIKNCLSDEVGTLAFDDAQGCIILIANKDKQSDLEKVFAKVAELVREKYVVGSLGYVECYIGLEVTDVLELSKSFKSANRLNICGVLEKSDRIYQSEEILFARANNRLNYSNQMESWVQAMIFGDPKSHMILKELFEAFEKANYLLTDLQTTATRMQDYLEKELALLNSHLEELYIVNVDQMDEKSIKKALEEMTDQVLDHVGKSSAGKDGYIGLKAVAYVEGHYTDSNLDLSQVCQALNVSVSYFSVVFKKHTSMTFVKFLNSYRIEKAQYFLEYTKESISAVSEMVGFVEPHYFGIVFKKYAGTTPKKYRMSRQ